jgi:Mlc titration factor MtfA (ptsG expression regulator)
MARHHVELFDVLRAYYRVDPREWVAENRQTRAERGAS